MEKILYIGMNPHYKSKVVQALLHEEVPQGGTIMGLRSALKVLCKKITFKSFPMVTLAQSEDNIMFYESIVEAASYVRTQKVYHDKIPQLVLVDIDIEPSRCFDEAQRALAGRFFGYGGQTPSITFLLTKHVQNWSPRDWNCDKKRGLYLFPKSINISVLIGAAHTLLEMTPQLQKAG